MIIWLTWYGQTIWSVLKYKEVIFYRMKGADHGGPMFFCEEMLDEVIKFIKKSIAHD